jgi:alpha-ketoglutarate-dependent taurine dioxygenase
MKLKKLNNAYEVLDIDLNNDKECIELGKIVADKCVVMVDQKISEERLYQIQTLWGEPSRALLHKYVGEKRLTGSHWREVLLNLGYISKGVKDFQAGMSRVSFAKNKKGKPTGIFTNGELDWHSDQQAHHDTQRVIGLMSLHGTEGSQTTFLRTAPIYEALNHEDKSMFDELVSVWEWDGGKMSEELIPSQMEIVKYHMVPYDGMECPLVDTTASGRRGIKFPSHSFRHFKGVSEDESQKIKKHLWSLLNKPEHIYTQNWKDGQIVFMDQNITLHARPTNVKDGDARTMTRMVTYMNNLFDEADPNEYVLYNGKHLDHETFANMVDTQRRSTYGKAA